MNKFRDIIEAHQESDPKIATEKSLLIGLVVKLMNQELAAMLQSSQAQNEILYVLFLYLSTLDRMKDQKVPNPRILLYSSSLKDHEDIKIRNAAGKQIEVFEGISSMSESLPQFIEEVKEFYLRNQMHIFGSEDELREHLHFKHGTQFQVTHYTPSFVEQGLEISRFLIKFLGDSTDLPEESADICER